MDDYGNDDGWGEDIEDYGEEESKESEITKRYSCMTSA